MKTQKTNFAILLENVMKVILLMGKNVVLKN